MNHDNFTERITHLSLCSGYEGIGLGLRRVLPNLREIAYVEREGFAVANLVAKMEAGELDAAPVFTDVKTFPYRKFRGCVDILSGGFPCQPFSAMPEIVKALKTQGTSSHTSETESESANPELFSSKTLKELSQVKPQTDSQFSNMSSESWKAWVTEQRREYSQRVKSAHLTRESESLSWATPIANDAKGSDYAGTRKNPKGLYLGGQVKNWPTASTRDHKGGYMGGRIRNGKVSMDTLDVAVQAYTKGGLLDQEKNSTNGKHQGQQLNPNWVEQLMGLPTGWTDCDFSETE